MTRNRNVADVQSNGISAVPPSTAGKNAIINGGFDIWQRGTSFSNLTGLIYTADRFQGSIGSMTSGTLSISRQSAGLTGFNYALRFQRNSGATTTGAGYFTCSLETENIIPLQGKTVTFSFYARAGANFSMGGSSPYLIVNTGTGTNENINNGYTGAATIISASPVLTTSWQRFTYTGTVGSTATELGFYLQYNGSGTAGAADYFEITGVQLEVGSTATPFSRNGGTIQGELAACQRYYFLSGGGQIGIAQSTVEVYVTIPNVMRAAPTVVTPLTAVILDRYGVGNYTQSTRAVVSSGTYVSANAAGVIYTNFTGLTAGIPYVVRTDGGSVILSSEL